MNVSPPVRIKSCDRTPPGNQIRYANVAQSVERTHGKGEVSGSIPDIGSIEYKRVLSIICTLYYACMIMFIKASNNKWYLTVSAIIFTVVAIAHLAIIVMQLPASIGSYTIPYEMNGLVVVVVGYLAIRGFMEAHKL